MEDKIIGGLDEPGPQESLVLPEKEAVPTERAKASLCVNKRASKRHMMLREKARSRIKLLRNIRGGPSGTSESAIGMPQVRARGILYLLHNCFPYHSGGYAVRAHGLLKGFQRAGWDVIAQARLGYPSQKDHSGPVSETQLIDGIDYRFLSGAADIAQMDQVCYIEEYAEAVLESVSHDRIGFVQAPSFFQNGFAGRKIADRLGVPLIYEMRGLEWFTNGSREATWQGSMYGIIGREMELEAARYADHVFTITESLRTWLVSHGLPKEKTSVLPNGCTVPEEPSLLARERKLADELDLDGAFVVGYIGSVVFYEGIETIVDAVEIVREQTGLDVLFVLVGDGPGMAAVNRHISERGAARFVRIVGRVPHEEVDRYYGLIDAFVMARIDLEICHVISPLKPLEVMSKRKLLMTSDVAAIKEMVDSSAGGAVTFKAGDAPSLAAHLSEIAANPARFTGVAVKGYDWASNHRTWDTLARNALKRIEDEFGPI